MFFWWGLVSNFGVNITHGNPQFFVRLGSFGIPLSSVWRFALSAASIDPGSSSESWVQRHGLLYARYASGILDMHGNYSKPDFFDVLF